MRIVIEDCDIFDNKQETKKSRNNLRRAKKSKKRRTNRKQSRNGDQLANEQNLDLKYTSNENNINYRQIDNVYLTQP